VQHNKINAGSSVRRPSHRPYRRSGRIAQFFRFLASGDARFITGGILVIDRGYTAQ
jgi:hypothetical protein